LIVAIKTPSILLPIIEMLSKEATSEDLIFREKGFFIEKVNFLEKGFIYEKNPPILKYVLF
jgi:hypothetical protein